MNPDHREGGWGVLLYVMAINTDKGSSVLSFVYRSIISKKLKKKLKILVSFEVKRQKKNSSHRYLLLILTSTALHPPSSLFFFPPWRPSTCQGKRGWHPNTSELSRSTLWLGRSRAWLKKSTQKKNKNKTPHQNKTHISQFRCKPTCLIAIIRPYKHSEEAAGMAADYLRESNNVGVCFLSHSRACNKPLAFVSTTLSRRMTSALKQ